MVQLSEEKIIQQRSTEILRLPTHIPWAAPPHAPYEYVGSSVRPVRAPNQNRNPLPMAPGCGGRGRGQGGPAPGRDGDHDDVSVRFDVRISLCSINECMSGVLNKSALPARPCPPPFLPMPPNKGLAAPWDVGNNYDCRGRRRRRWGSVVRVRCHCLSVRCSVPRATYAHTSHAHGM